MHKYQALGENVGKESIKAGYEVTDLNTRVVGMFLVFLGLLTVGALIIIVILMRGYESARVRPEVSPLAQDDAMVAPAPNLQSNPRFDKDNAIEAATTHLNSFGWRSQDPAVTRAHIPIEDAMRLMATEAVPYKPKPVMAGLGAEDAEGSASPAEAPAAAGANQERPAAPSVESPTAAENE